jgi:hypothetical protein
VHHHLSGVEPWSPPDLATQTPTNKGPTPVPQVGSGAFVVADPSDSTVIDDPTVTYSIEIEEGLPFAVDTTAATIDAVLSDSRGWSAGGHRPQHVSDGDFRIVLASPSTTDELCAPLQTEGRLSCRNGDDVVINAWRWENGSPDYAERIDEYRVYVINHEVGHVLGHGHRPCPRSGAPAPVMQQQTKGLAGCEPNVWPLPEELNHP